MAVAYASHSGASLASLGSTDLVIDKPAGTVEGDLLTCFIILSANVTITPPAGWTVEVNASGVKAYRKVAGASEPASYTFVRGTITNTLVGQIARLTGVDTADPIDTIAALASAGSNTAVLPSVDVADGFFLWQQVAVLSNSTWTPPGTTTEDYDFQPPTQSHAVAGGHETVGAGATGTRTWTSTSTGTRSGVIRAIRAAPEPPVDLTPDDTTHAHTSDAASLTQAHELAPSDSVHAHATDAAALTQIHELAPDGSDHGHSSDATSLTQVHELAPDDSLHTHTSDSTSVTEDGGIVTLFPDVTRHGHSTQATSLTQVHELQPDDSTHTHTSGSAVVTLPVEPSSARTHVVPAENRTSVVAADDRRHVVPAESRTSVA